ncbi:MAG TPA: hypothetical protein DCG87_07930 [Synergistaceae bacterium]|nr:hypothetical protein [Synergistaceae bacterium]
MQSFIKDKDKNLCRASPASAGQRKVIKTLTPGLRIDNKHCVKGHLLAKLYKRQGQKPLQGKPRIRRST